VAAGNQCERHYYEQNVKKKGGRIRSTKELTRGDGPHNPADCGNNYRRRGYAHQGKQVTTIESHRAINKVTRSQRHQVEVVSAGCSHREKILTRSCRDVSI
jgi:hypothetical protein